MEIVITTLLISLPGIIISIVLFVLFYRNRKQDQLTRRRSLLPFLLVSAHTILFPLGVSLWFLCESNGLGDFLGYLWFIVLPLILLITVMIYWGHFTKWKNFELRAATIMFTLYLIATTIALLAAFSGIGC